VIALLVLAGPFLWIVPLLFIFRAMYADRQASKIKDTINGSYSDFWLNEEEKKDYTRVLSDYKEAQLICEEARLKGYKARLNHNNDGSFSRRSKLGKELNEVLYKYVNIKFELELELVGYIEIPRTRWEEFNNQLTAVRVSIISAFIWLIGLLSCGATSEFDNAEDDSGFWMIGATVICLIGYLILKKVPFSPALKYSPIPEEVNESNYNSY